jgi:PAS domain S-box-containing protein
MPGDDAKKTADTVDLPESGWDYRALFENVAAGIGRSRLSDGKPVLANKALAEMFGYSSIDEFLEKFSFAGHYENPEERLQAIENLKNNPNLKYELSLKKPDGSPVTVQAAGHLNEDGEHLDFVIVDITERKNAEAALRESENRYRTLATSSPVGIFHTNAEGQVTSVNEKWCEIGGLSVEDALGDGWRNALHPDDRDTIVSRWNDHSEGAALQQYEQRYMRGDGSISYCFVQSVGEADEAGNIIGYIGTVTDITKQKLAEAPARQALVDAQHANRAKSNFLSTMSHEIRTPLNGVLGLAQLLTSSDLDADQRKKVETILSSGHTLLAILNDVLDMSRIEAGGLELEETTFSLRDLISTISSPFQNLADDKGVTLRSTSQLETGGIITGDPVRLRQIIWNLLSNAIKFTDEGSVTLAVSDTGVADGKVGAAKGQVMHISVSDTGSGISAERLDSIFDAFSQEDSSISRKFGGTGLGLSIVKQLTDLMDGTIEVESKVDYGTRFDVYLPFNRATETEAEELRLRRLHEEIEEVATMKILVAEDNEVNAMIAHAFLQKFGHQVKIAVNGREAVQIARENWADVILMDIHMPEMDGIEATRIIRSSDAGSMIPIIGVTAEAFAERHDQFVAAGMDDVLTKPFTEQQLAKMLVPYGQSMDGISGNPRVIAKETPAGAAAEVPEADAVAEPIGNDEGLDAFTTQAPPEVMRSLLGKAGISLEKRMDDIRRGLEIGDSNLIHEAAHTIKGSCGSMFATRISALAIVVEDKSKDMDAIRDLMPTMEHVAEETVDWWRSKVK